MKFCTWTGTNPQLRFYGRAVQGGTWPFSASYTQQNKPGKKGFFPGLFYKKDVICFALCFGSVGFVVFAVDFADFVGFAAYCFQIPA